MEQVKAGLRVLGLVAGLTAAGPAAAAPVVVLDPGHGGAQGGTKTKDGVFEKTIVLRIAEHAKAALEAKGVRCVLTRPSDRTLGLDERAERARAEGAKVFVSIHNNWAPVPERRGVETYILSAHASDEVAEALLHAEESAEPDAEPEAVGSDLDFILGDLDRASAHEDSAHLAKRVQDHLGKVRGLGPSRGLRQAPFRVLKGATMAAVLVEVGYLSHAAQGRLLASKRGQRAAGKALARGILAFLSKDASR